MYLVLFKVAYEILRTDCSASNKPLSFIFFSSDPNIARASLHPPHLTDSKGLPSLIPFCAYQGDMELFGEYIPGLDFPVCNSFKPKILDGELCYALKFSSQFSDNRLESKAGRGKGLLLAIDNGISIEPKSDHKRVAKRKNVIRTEMKSTGNRVMLHILTSHRYDDARPGKYAMKSLKVMAATENFLAMPDDTKKCQIEVKEDCKSRHYVEEVQKECGCIPWALRSVAFEKVSQNVCVEQPKFDYVAVQRKQQISGSLHLQFQ